MRHKQGKVREDGRVSWTMESISKAGAAFATRMDGWKNVVTGLGIQGRDKRLGATFTGGTSLAHQKTQLEHLFGEDDIVGTFVELPAEEMTRKWFDLKIQTIKGESDQELTADVMTELKGLGAQEIVTDAIVWSRLFGGSVILLGVDDGQEPEEELNLDGIKSLNWLSVLDRWEIEVQSLYKDPNHPKYGLPEMYRINTTNAKGEANVGTFIHESRTIRFDGVRVTRHRRQQNNGWGDPVLSRNINDIRDFQSASGGIAHVLQDFSQAVFKIKGLAKALASDEDGLVLQRLQLLDIAKSMVRAIPLDAEMEEYTRDGASVTGLADLYDRLMMKVSSSTRMPVTLLFGRSPAGENATGESDIRNFYDGISAKQESKLTPKLEYLLTIIMLAKEGPTGGVEPDSWSIEWVPLYQESSKEQADTRLSTAQADAVYLDRGVVSADEVANSRFGGDTYSPDTQLDKEQRALEGDERKRLTVANRSGNIPQLEEADGVIPNTDAEEDAPNYRLQEDVKHLEQVCIDCGFSNGRTCTRWKFETDAGFTCDDYITPGAGLPRSDSKRLTQLKSKRRKRRGRNY